MPINRGMDKEDAGCVCVCVYIYTQTVEYYSVLKEEWNNVICVTWMDPKIIILREVSQKKEDKYHMISLVCGI